MNDLWHDNLCLTAMGFALLLAAVVLTFINGWVGGAVATVALVLESVVFWRQRP